MNPGGREKILIRTLSQFLPGTGGKTFCKDIGCPASEFGTPSDESMTLFPLIAFYFDDFRKINADRESIQVEFRADFSGNFGRIFSFIPIMKRIITNREDR